MPIHKIGEIIPTGKFREATINYQPWLNEGKQRRWKKRLYTIYSILTTI
jgi:hypothetical protein